MAYIKNMFSSSGTGILKHANAMIITDEVDDFCNEKSEEWFEGQDGGCSCHILPPCSFCESGFSLPLAEYLELALEWEYGDDYASSSSHDNYDRAMKDLF